MTWRNRWEALREDPSQRADVYAEEVKNALAANLSRIRRAKKLSQNDLAVMIGTKQPNISDLESGDANPTLDRLVRLSVALECSVKDLLIMPDENRESWSTPLDEVIALSRGIVYKAITKKKTAFITFHQARGLKHQYWAYVDMTSDVPLEPTNRISKVIHAD